MKSLKFITLLSALAITVSTGTFAFQISNDKNSVEFFISNNTKEINLQTAFNRLSGSEQHKLQNKIINVLQKEHIEQGKFKNLLGTYQYSSKKNTADNSELFVTSSYQKLPIKKIFRIAKQLANSLNQESVAVFIPSKQSGVGDTILKFKSHNYSINETIKIIHEKLPAQYSKAFSLHLNNNCSSFDNAIVKEVQWLGSKIKPQELRKSFPNEDIYFYHGNAYLVFKNGQKEQL